MAKTRIVGSAGRFGVRYGQRVKRRIADIESKQRKKQKCIFCHGKAVRLSKGIWHCRKCGKKFAGHAYYIEETLDIKPGEEKKREPKVLNKEKTSKKDNKKLTEKEIKE